VGHFLWQVVEHSSVGTWINTAKEDITMTMWNKLLITLDQLFGLPNKISSKVKKLQQGFDNRTQEHVIWFEYRIKVRNAIPPRPDPNVFEEERIKRERGSKIINAILDDVLKDHPKRPRN
jgi:hypothetical protein